MQRGLFVVEVTIVRRHILIQVEMPDTTACFLGVGVLESVLRFVRKK